MRTKNRARDRVRPPCVARRSFRESLELPRGFRTRQRGLEQNGEMMLRSSSTHGASESIARVALLLFKVFGRRVDADG